MYRRGTFLTTVEVAQLARVAPGTVDTWRRRGLYEAKVAAAISAPWHPILPCGVATTPPTPKPRRLPREPFARWLREHLTVNLAAEMGLSYESLCKIRNGSRGPAVSRSHVEDGLARVGLGLWEVYPKEEFPDLHPQEAQEVATHAWCPACEEEVAIDRGALCLWCDAATEPLSRSVA
jgi:hypothetical protein